MIDIFIKSFNRPFYLDRCITSVYKNVSGNFKITVLDDGTPDKYLSKISKKYPEVKIVKSNFHHQKSTSVENKENINANKIPTNFWRENIAKASDYLIVTEDDVWFTKPIDLDELVDNAKKRDINLIKLGWLGNTKDLEDVNKKPVSENIETAQPKKLLLFPKKLMTAFFYNQFKFFTILYRLGFANHHSQRKYWQLNSILMGFYRKDYWLEIWKGLDDKVEERKQLLNAAIVYRKNKNNPNFISKLKSEAMKTTFQSSAANSCHEYGFDFDVNTFNYLINEAWFDNQIDVMQNYPNDFSTDYLNQFVDKNINVSEFKKWIEQFKSQYRSTGCETD